MTPVSSSAVSHVGYDPKSKVLHVRFQSGKLYRYTEVEPSEHASLTSAASLGKHLNHHFSGKGELVLE